MNDIDLLYRQYIQRTDGILSGGLMGRDEFELRARAVTGSLASVRSDHGGGRGLMYYRLWEENGKKHCTVPLTGYYAEDEKTAVRLFRALADRVVQGCPCDFSVELYAADTECIRAFHMMQFGTMAETGVMKLEPSDESSAETADIRVLSKDEISARWTGIWEMTHAIVRHLQRSPVFYPGTEFTEELYRDFYLDENTELIVSFRDGDPVGMIEWNRESSPILSGARGSVNAGEIYVVPQLRGTELSEKLMRFAGRRASAAGAEYMWVEHGTANPEARGFWNRYFTTYRYLLTRTVDGAAE